MWEEPLQARSEPSGTGADKTAMAEGLFTFCSLGHPIHGWGNVTDCCGCQASILHWGPEALQEPCRFSAPAWDYWDSKSWELVTTGCQPQWETASVGLLLLLMHPATAGAPSHKHPAANNQQSPAPHFSVGDNCYYFSRSWFNKLF